MAGEISLTVFSPLLQTDITSSRNIDWSSYSHTINAFSGFDSANFSVGRLGEDDARFWMQRGIGSRVVAVSHGVIAWEGFIDQIDVTINSVKISIGPLTDMANKIAVAYQGTEADPFGITYGGQGTITAFADNLISQELYGIFQEVLSGGTGTSTMIVAARDTYLGENSWPRISRTIASGEGISVSVKCLGYVHMLDKTVYPNPSDANAYINASDKVVDVLSAELNGYFTDFRSIESNTLQVPAFVDDNRTCLSIIKDVVALGDASGNRYMFGVYADRIAEYKAIPTEAEYEFNSLESDGLLRQYATETTVWPSLVRPGKWVKLSGLLLEQSAAISSNREGKDLEFIESVSFNAPFSFSTKSGKFNTAGQMIAQLGLASQV